MLTQRNPLTVPFLSLLLAGGALLPLPGHAQTGTPPVPAAETLLSIPTPPGVTVQVQIDIHDRDLLGVVKSALRGLATGAAKAASAAGTAKANAAQSVIANADVDDIVAGTLKNITHVHFLTFQYPGSVAQEAIPKSYAAASALLATLPDQTAFYATAFAQEGGSTLLSSTQNGTRVLIDGFAPGHGFALAAQSPAGVAVLRADGYPDLAKIAALFAQIGALTGHSLPAVPGTK